MPRNGVGPSLIEPAPIGMVERRGTAFETFLDFVHGFGEIGPDDIHLVDEDQPRHGILVRLPPNGFRLGLDPLLGVEDNDAPRRARAGSLRPRP